MLPAQWSSAQRRLHWWTASLVGLGFVLGWAMVAVPLRALLTKFLLYQAHKTLGLLVLLLTLARLPVRLTLTGALGVASAGGGLRGSFRVATGRGSGAMRARTRSWGVIPVPHLVGTDLAWFAVLRQVHRALAILLVALATAHALAALANHLRGHRGLVAMWRG